MYKKLKNYLKQYPLLVKTYHAMRHFFKYELIDIRDSYLSKSSKLKITPYGFKLMGSYSMHHRAMQEGTFEPEEVVLFKEHFLQADLIVDIGSNIGFYACLARSLGKKVIAVEPLPKNLEYLFSNLLANGWNDVEVFPVGLSEEPGLATLYGASSTGASLINNWAGATKFFQRTIPLSTLDILLGDRFTGKKIFIKIDVEGFEYPVLLGSVRVMQMRPKPTWVLEVCLNEYHPEGVNPNFRDVFNIFWRNGYEVRTADENHKLIQPADVARWVNCGNCDSGTINYMFVPKG
jgi:FkbM family methyltransferase